MIQCPECRQMIPDDSAFCDQCGKELKWCPECKRPKRGTECPVCGSDLIPGRKWLAGDATGQAGAEGGAAPEAAATLGTLRGGTAPAVGSSGRETAEGAVSPSAPQPTATSAAGPAALVGNGWRLKLGNGAFGRSGGIWPELASCQYVSGSHGIISGCPGAWTISDRGSTNGTFINGRKLATGETCPLKPGDKVRIATLDFIVE